MIGWRTLWEVFHVLLGVAVAYVIARLSAWAYPLARNDIWVVAIVAMVVTVLLGVSPVRRAVAQDRANSRGGKAKK